MKIEDTECSETSAYNILRLGNHSKERVQHSEHGQSLKSRIIISIWNKKELPKKWKESIIVLIYKQGDKTDCSNYMGISLLPTT